MQRIGPGVEVTQSFGVTPANVGGTGVARTEVSFLRVLAGLVVMFSPLHADDSDEEEEGIGIMPARQLAWRMSGPGPTTRSCSRLLNPRGCSPKAAAKCPAQPRAGAVVAGGQVGRRLVVPIAIKRDIPRQQQIRPGRGKVRAKIRAPPARPTSSTEFTNSSI